MKAKTQPVPFMNGIIRNSFCI